MSVIKAIGPIESVGFGYDWSVDEFSSLSTSTRSLLAALEPTKENYSFSSLVGSLGEISDVWNWQPPSLDQWWNPGAGKADLSSAASSFLKLQPTGFINDNPAYNLEPPAVVPVNPSKEQQVSFLNGLNPNGTLVTDSDLSYWTNTGRTAKKWGPAAAGAGATITYKFNPASNFTQTEKDTFLAGFRLWESVANVTFVENAATGAVTLTRGTSGAFENDNANNGSGSTLGTPTSATISINTNTPGFDLSGSLDVIGGYGMSTVIHEIGHLIGLGHGGYYNGAVTPSTQQFSQYDERQWTIMSYIHWGSSGPPKYKSSYEVANTDWGSDDGYLRQAPHTMMQLDILAIQQLYGASTSGPFTGGQTYGFNSNITGVLSKFFDFNLNPHPVVTLYNTGSGNTLDLSGFTQSQIIKLAPGAFSSVGGHANNLSIGSDTWIDAVFGGSGVDAITGNAHNNNITGGGGADNIDGAGGIADVAVYTGTWLEYGVTNASGTYTVTDTAIGRDGTDTAVNVEFFSFGGFAGGVANAVSAAPIANNDNNTGDAVVETGVTAGDAAAAGSVLSNDSDANAVFGDTKTVTGVRTGAEAAGGAMGALGPLTGIYGTLTLNSNGAYSYVLDDTDADTNLLAVGAAASDVFTYKVRDARGLVDVGELTIIITGANDAIVINSGGGGPTANVSVIENTAASTAITTVTSSDVDGPSRTYTLSGADFAKFHIDASTGVLTFVAAPDFDAPADANGDGIYSIIVTASDGAGASDSQAIAVSVINVGGHTIVGHKTKADTIDGTKPVGNAATDEEDFINGRGGNDSIRALGGNDTVRGGSGKDSLDGGAGTSDVVDFSDMTKSVELKLKGSSSATAKLNGVADDKVKNFEGILGGKAADMLTGDTKANLLSGNAGNDSIDGGSGKDTVDGGLGSDQLKGSAQADWFRFSSKLGATNVDKIADFTHDTDFLALDDAIFANIGGTMDDFEFVKGRGATKAKDGDDRIIYDTKTGKLFYDDDGNKSGGHAPIHFATLTNKPASLDYGDFAIV
jgi:VCBS repeat-containing protein